MLVAPYGISVVSRLLLRPHSEPTNRITPIVGVATDVLNMWHAVSNAAVKPFVVLGSKKPSLVRIGNYQHGGAPYWAGARLVPWSL